MFTDVRFEEIFFILFLSIHFAQCNLPSLKYYTEVCHQNKMFRCKQCSTTLLNIRLYDKHQIIHANDPHLDITCYHLNCKKNF